VGGADLHKRFSARKVGRKPKGGRVAPILDGPGAAPPNPARREARLQSPKGVRLRQQAVAPCGREGRSVRKDRSEAQPESTRSPKARCPMRQ
jgi:hypothetical protein